VATTGKSAHLQWGTISHSDSSYLGRDSRLEGRRLLGSIFFVAGTAGKRGRQREDCVYPNVPASNQNESMGELNVTRKGDGLLPDRKRSCFGNTSLTMRGRGSTEEGTAAE